MLQLVRVTDALPEGFQVLRAEAEAEGHRHLSRLAGEDLACFHALLAACRDGELVGIGGLTPEPEPAGEPAWRMRRLYVAPGARRAGVGSAIANALLQEALDSVRLVTVHAGGPAAGAFWEAVGFRSVRERPWSHEFRF